MSGQEKKISLEIVNKVENGPADREFPMSQALRLLNSKSGKLAYKLKDGYKISDDGTAIEGQPSASATSGATASGKGKSGGTGKEGDK